MDRIREHPRHSKQLYSCAKVREVALLLARNAKNKGRVPAPAHTHTHILARTHAFACRPFARGALNKRLLWHAQNLHDALDLLGFVFPGKQRVPRVQLCEHTTQRPHIDGHAVAQPQNYFRRAIETRLDVRVDAFVDEAARPEVDQSNHLHTSGSFCTSSNCVLTYYLSTTYILSLFKISLPCWLSFLELFSHINILLQTVSQTDAAKVELLIQLLTELLDDFISTFSGFRSQ